MPKERRNFSGSVKMAILRESLVEKVPISEVCDKHGLPPTMFYAWQKKLFEEGAAVFEPRCTSGRAKSSRQQAAGREPTILAGRDRKLDEARARRKAARQAAGMAVA